MFTYIYLGTNDLGRAIKFYDATMRVLGHRRCITGRRPGRARRLISPLALDEVIQPIGRGVTIALKGSCGRPWFLLRGW
jgi:hypothetical protein